MLYIPISSFRIAINRSSSKGWTSRLRETIRVNFLNKPHKNPHGVWLFLRDEGMMEIGPPGNCVNHNINFPNLQRDLCQNLEEHQPSLLLEIQLWLDGIILQT
jgi:hypothetical protein